MYIPEDREPVKEYSVDDESIKNIVEEISDEDGFQAYLVKLSELLECIETKKINTLINYLVYGMVLNDGKSLECISAFHSEFKTLLDEYYSSLDKVEEALSTKSKLEAVKFPDLVNSLRMEKDYYKKHKKEIDSYIKMLPDIRKNLEDISCKIMGIG